jgi:hypothetical protein
MMSFRDDEITNKLRVNQTSEFVFTVHCDGQDVAWCQWSPVWKMWRVLMLTDNRVHHLADLKSIFSLCADEIGVDII